MYTINVKNLRLPVGKPTEELAKIASERLGLERSELVDAQLHKRSIDARRRAGRPIEFVCSVTVICEITEKKLAKILAKSPDFELIRTEPLVLPEMREIGNSERPTVVGFGPCGMFAALILAEGGYRPIVLERGGSVKERSEAVAEFMRAGRLDPDSNIQFGAGGAGTFSDGKLVTRINDPKCSYVLERLVEFGAPSEVKWLAKPHVGTDKLLGVVDRIRDRIESLGGEVRFNSRLADLTIVNNRVKSLKIESRNGSYELECGKLILAVGHSARDTYELLASRGIELAPKPFSVGVRVEHLREDIDRALYGELAGRLGEDGKPILPPGEYAVSMREKQPGLVSDSARGVYSFCMCPGGEVVAAASELGGVVTNGMSRYARDGRNSNAAIAVSVFPEDVGGHWRDGIDFQRRLEGEAFKLGGSDYSAPVETLGDFMDGKTSHFTEPKRITPTYREESGAWRLADLSQALPSFVTDMLRKGFPYFGRKLRGFDARDAILTGVETRTSAPVRIPRGEGFTCKAAANLYPGGEGAGYAGGITSAAVDGINLALAVMNA